MPFRIDYVSLKMSNPQCRSTELNQRYLGHNDRHVLYFKMI